MVVGFFFLFLLAFGFNVVIVLARFGMKGSDLAESEEEILAELAGTKGMEEIESCRIGGVFSLLTSTWLLWLGDSSFAASLVSAGSWDIPVSGSTLVPDPAWGEVLRWDSIIAAGGSSAGGAYAGGESVAMLIRKTR